jgi:3-oxoacyl-[acyl-carrier protein] reductase
MITPVIDLTGKAAIVTGATKGMGAAIAEIFARSGARVVLTSRTAADGEAMARVLNERYGGDNVIAVSQSGSLEKKADLQRVVDKAVEAFGRIDVLVCVPSIRPWFGSSIETPDDEIDRQFTHIFKSRFWITSLCIPHMIEAGGGSVIYIGSGSAFEATSERSTYACVRAAEAQLMRNFAAEFGSRNIRLNTIAPSFIQSHGSAALFQDTDTVAKIAAGLPMRRPGTTDEIAAAAAFLASDASSFTTGTVLPVDGGRHLHAVPARLTKLFANEQAVRLKS